MGYDPKATLIKKEIKTLANGDKFFIKLMKKAIEDNNRQANYRKQRNDDAKQSNHKWSQTVIPLKTFCLSSHLLYGGKR